MFFLWLFVFALLIYVMHVSAKMSDIERRLDRLDEQRKNTFKLPSELPVSDNKKAAPAGIPASSAVRDEIQRKIDEIKIDRLPVLEKESEKTVDLSIKTQETFADKEKTIEKFAGKDENKSIINWELFTGVKLFAWIGGFAAFLGLIFFTEYAIDRINPVTRIFAGIVIGLLFISAGLRTRSEKLKTTGDVLSAIGVVFIYVSAYASSNIYHIWNDFASFMIMIAASIGALDISLRKNSKSIAVLAAVCGYLTPILFSASNLDITAVFTFTAVITFTIMATALKKDWSFLSWLAFAGVSIISVMLTDTTFRPEVTARIYEFFCIMFTAFALINIKKFKLENNAYRLAPLLYNIFSLIFVYLTLDKLSPSSSGYQALELLLVISACNAMLMINGKYFETGFLFSSGISYILLLIWTHGFLEARTLWLGLGSYFMLFIISAVLPLFVRRDKNVLYQTFDAFLVSIFVLLGAAMIKIKPASPDIFIIAGSILSVLAFILMLINKTRQDISFFIASVMLFALQLLWQLSYSSAGNPYHACLWYFIVFTLFFSLVFLSRKRLWDMQMPWFTVACSGAFQCLLIYLTAENIPEIAGYFGIIPAVFAVIFGASLAHIMSFGNNDDDSQTARIGIFAAALLLFITMIFPAQFKTQWLDVSWALEAAVLIGLFKFINYKQLKYWGFWIFVVVFFKNVIPDTSAFEVSAGNLLNWYLYVYAILIAAMFIGAHFWKPAEEKHFDVNNKNTILSFAVILLFVLLNIEIAAFFAAGTHITFSLNNSFAQDMAYTLCWGIFAIALFVSGIIKDLKAARLSGLALLLAATLKLFLHDLWSLGQLYRIGSLFGSAAILILVSFLYQKYIGKINKNSKKE
ncbi:MAG: DUF2339 domain-containing protein [Endomicrobium sp.]|jgi:hypothetical protein|nr:DUF2339 domain-containing protein [Endomicrobium sp.]